ncbi:hypothetical protein FQA39_LY00076 [Lamprigera yunnana]|nr:hypothetical protein FQA39_LY00076 [Lamprigera yunnana]
MINVSETMNALAALLIFVPVIAISTSTEVICTHEALPKLEDCGLNPISDRIIGGSTTDLDEFPWVTALEYTNKYTGQASILCGGSLITKRHIITAGHCISTPHYELTTALLGDWNISTDPDCISFLGFKICNREVQKIKIASVVHHPDYNDDTLWNDIGVLFLAHDAEITNFVKPICLPSPKFQGFSLPTTLVAVGWGVTENGTSSDVKLKVALPLKTNKECETALQVKMNDHQLCVGGEVGKDTCGGDSGGPLMNYYIDEISGDSHWFLVGVVSFGCTIKSEVILTETFCGQYGAYEDKELKTEPIDYGESFKHEEDISIKHAGMHADAVQQFLCNECDFMTME